MRDRHLLSILVSCALLAMAASPLQAANDASAKCLRCHKKNGSMEGVHSTIGEQGLACTSCHGDQGSHPRKKAPVIEFGTDSQTEVALQNQRCARCHKPVKLRNADWTHDVHQDKVGCADCHQLHPHTDPISQLDEIGRTQLCVDCHGSQQ
ncbi:cytochrome c-type protein NrfB [Ferrimonas sediminum]|uniref:Cytochrome c-type protein NrfB n=1 Tax=Ferrimonas sediminum TaxID=718193 RepID=A0A1G8K0W0_9GAMM|nr:multiheme c-type cytochrome [Ferrimonas sediminum]SDI37071.1 cytochrome c-type protein NrfB [Ferrimonas sediminum]